MTVEERIAEVKKSKPYLIFDRVDRNETLYFFNPKCDRCGGKGYIPVPFYPDGGRCYRCGGSGRDPKPSVIKFYTEKHEAELKRQREARQKKRDEEKYKQLCANYDERIKKLGFGKEDDEYVIYRIYGETFSIKDTLKELGCRFRPGLGWYSPVALEDYPGQRMTREEVLDGTCYPLIQWKDLAEIEKVIVNPAVESKSHFIGEIGQRLTVDVLVKRALESRNRFNGHLVFSYLYIMEDNDGNVFTWSTQKYFKEGSTYKLCGTVKDHTDYKGTPQTVLTRCKEVE